MTNHTHTDMKYLRLEDYVVIGMLMVISLCIGLFYAIRSWAVTDTQDYLLAGRKMHPIPVALSLLASYLSAISYLGTPSEIYLFGTQYWVICFAYVIMMIMTSFVYIPVYFNLGLTSVYEYLEKRFGSKTRIVASAISIFQGIFYLAIALYAPSLAINAATGLRIDISILTVGLVCTFYTTVGGMKAVIWTDVFQIILMMCGVFSIVIMGLKEVGGFSEVWTRNVQGGRIEFFNFDPNPLTRHTVWSLVIGGSLTWITIYSATQSQVQRCFSVKTLKNAQIALWMNLPGLSLFASLYCICGLIVYAYYQGCDPLSIKRIQAADQILPLFVMDIMSNIRGLSGLFLAALFSGTLSTISSGINALAALILEDIIKKWKSNLLEKQASFWTKCVALICGILCTGLAFACGLLGNLLQGALGLLGMVGGLSLGLFSLGIFFPWANEKGALVGLFASAATVLWIGIGAAMYKPPEPTLLLSTESCSNITQSIFNVTLNKTVNNYSSVFPLYKISYLWYSGVSVCVIILVGILISFCTGITDAATLDPRLIFPLFYKICWLLPHTYRKKLLFGVKYNGEFGVFSYSKIPAVKLNDLHQTNV